MGKENGQIEEIENGEKSEDEIEIESDMPCKVEPTEVETIQEISKVSHSWVINMSHKSGPLNNNCESRWKIYGYGAFSGWIQHLVAAKNHLYISVILVVP